ncbi:MAG: hypothetical protein GF411_11805 [Candidatus Lokiarchaeota archaeon]|nr:hypothetical protein [Candidatus Lokiarchaeota archaeon]
MNCEVMNVTARIVHISDTHLGTKFRQGVKHNVWGIEMRSRLLEHDFYERFEELFQLIAKEDPPVDAVIHSGDLYNSPWENNPTHPPAMAEQTVIRVIKEFIEKTNIPVLILEGNHGIWRSLNVSLLDTLEMSVPGLDVATQDDFKRALANEEPLKYSYDNLDVFCFPFVEYNVLESSDLLAEFNDWITTHQRPDNNRPSVAVAHGMDLDRTLFPSMFSMDYDYIALGHDHKQHSYSKKAWYAGCPERWRFDEVKHEKGYLLVEIESGKEPIVVPKTLTFRRLVLNERIKIESDDTVDTVIEKIKALLKKAGVKTEWNSKTAARVRIVFEGESPRFGSLDLGMAMESLRLNLLASDSEYNLVQLVWSIKQSDTEFVSPAYPEIESEYLIEDPEADFRAYLETLEIDEKFDPTELTKIAVRALKIAAGQSDERLTLDTLPEEE